MNYVVGFLFSEDLRHVALIRKNRPAWQAGKYNGVGGKIEPFDSSSLAAMTREFFEETGVEVPQHEWNHFLTMHGGSDAAHPESKRAFEIDFFRSASNKIWQVTSKTDEPVAIFESDVLPETVPNLKFLVPMATLPDFLRAEVYYR